MTDWLTYFTPTDLSEALLRKVRLREPESIVDICAGRGNLLNAAARRWPSARLMGNDLYREQPDDIGVIRWSRREGRGFAQDMRASGGQVDLVVANPPFGKARPLADVDRDLPPEVQRLLRSPRIECGMTVASALLVGPHGTLATIVPESLVHGPSYRRLREWLGSVFADVEVIQLARQKFGRRDLGVAFLIARRRLRTRKGPLPIASPFLDGGRPSPARGPVRIKITRGVLTSAALTRAGGAMVVHYGDHANGSAYRVRSTSLASARAIPAESLVQPGDVLVCRVGRYAGVASIYSGTEPAALTDCVLRVRGANENIRRALRKAVRAGLITKFAQQAVHGLGARFITQADLAAAASRAVESLPSR